MTQNNPTKYIRKYKPTKEIIPTKRTKYSRKYYCKKIQDRHKTLKRKYKTNGLRISDKSN